MIKSYKKHEVVFEIVMILARNGRIHMNSHSIHNSIIMTFPSVTKRQVRDYLNEMCRSSSMAVESIQGKDGGYRLETILQSYYIGLAGVSFSDRHRNALNDAFEIASVSKSFHYKIELDEAKKLLYSIKDFKDDDYEKYIGQNKTNNDHSEKIDTIKQYISKRMQVDIEVSVKSENTKVGVHRIMPLWIIHDSDESFLVYRLKPGGKAKYVDIDYIEKITPTNLTFHHSDENPNIFINNSTIKNRKSHTIKFNILLGINPKSIFRRNMQADISQDAYGIYSLTFHEEYRLSRFLFEHSHQIQIIDINKKMLNEFKKKLRRIDLSYIDNDSI